MNACYKKVYPLGQVLGAIAPQAESSLQTITKESYASIYPRATRDRLEHPTVDWPLPLNSLAAEVRVHRVIRNAPRTDAERPWTVGPLSP